MRKIDRRRQPALKRVTEAQKAVRAFAVLVCHCELYVAVQRAAAAA